MATSSDKRIFSGDHLTEIDRLGTSIAAYARGHDLSAQSLYGGRRQLQNESSPISPPASSSPRFAEVVPAVAPRPASAMLIRIGAVSLSFDQLPEPAWLGQLIGAVPRQ